MNTLEDVPADFVSKTCDGEICHCGLPATNKIGEEIAFDDPRYGTPHHNLTRYVCEAHFRELFFHNDRRALLTESEKLVLDMARSLNLESELSNFQFGTFHVFGSRMSVDQVRTWMHEATEVLPGVRARMKTDAEVHRSELNKIGTDLTRIRMSTDNTIEQLNRKMRRLEKEVEDMDGAQVDALRNEVDFWKQKAEEYKIQLREIRSLTRRAYSEDDD